MIKKLAAGVLALILILLAGAAVAETLVMPLENRGIVPQGRNASGNFDNNPAIPGQSGTTGLPFEGPYVPFLVNIDNVTGAWPQWGIADADIIYEMPIHGLALTRLVALFADKHPEQVGPVRSGRVMHAELREEWDAAWVFAGVQNKEGSSVSVALRKFGARDKPVNLIFDFTTNKWVKHTHNVKTHHAPHNHSVHLAELVPYSSDFEFPVRPFLFTDELPSAGVPATSISLAYGSEQKSYTNSSYRYDPQTNLYSRFRNGELYEDANNPGQALTFSNVIVQWTELRFNDAANAPLLKEVGEGNADIFTGGKYIAGYWLRESVTGRTIFFDAQGNEIQLQRGKTWINITADRSTKVRYE